MVQLKDLLPRIIYSFISLFQFLYGTIKSRWLHGIERFDIQFQFLYGTIKSKIGIKGAIVKETHFNSYMVQLKVDTIAAGGTA